MSFCGSATRDDVTSPDDTEANFAFALQKIILYSSPAASSLRRYLKLLCPPKDSSFCASPLWKRDWPSGDKEQQQLVAGEEEGQRNSLLEAGAAKQAGGEATQEIVMERAGKDISKGGLFGL